LSSTSKRRPVRPGFAATIALLCWASFSGCADNIFGPDPNEHNARIVLQNIDRVADTCGEWSDNYTNELEAAVQDNLDELLANAQPVAVKDQSPFPLEATTSNGKVRVAWSNSGDGSFEVSLPDTKTMYREVVSSTAENRREISLWHNDEAIIALSFVSLQESGKTLEVPKESSCQGVQYMDIDVNNKAKYRYLPDSNDKPVHTERSFWVNLKEPSSLFQTKNGPAYSIRSCRDTCDSFETNNEIWVEKYLPDADLHSRIHSPLSADTLALFHNAAIRERSVP
jgi:hypothetical protein